MKVGAETIITKFMWQTILHTARTRMLTHAIILNNVMVNFRPGEYMRMIFLGSGR